MNYKKLLIEKLKAFRRKLIWGRLESDQEDIRNLLIDLRAEFKRDIDVNPISKKGKKCFSQGDEDGITLEIIRRLDLVDGVFVELGVGNGMENNTLILKALGWSGVWISGEPIVPRIGSANDHFIFDCCWITKSNITEKILGNLQRVGRDNINFLSVDLDGNDLLYVKEFLQRSKLRPEVICVEYNAKFPPPIKWSMPFNEDHTWASDDYFGASLMSYVELLSGFDYSLVACNNMSGANAFFIHNKHSARFDDVPKNVDDVYKPPNYNFSSKHGHKQSVKLVQELLDSSKL